jgi:hypothetical protein
MLAIIFPLKMRIQVIAVHQALFLSEYNATDDKAVESLILCTMYDFRHFFCQHRESFVSLI